MLTVLVPVASDFERPRRLFYSLAMKPPKAAFEVVVADVSDSGVALSDLNLFRGSFKWKWLRPNGRKYRDILEGEYIEDHCSGDTAVVIPGFVMPVGDALSELTAHYLFPGIAGNVLDAGVAVVEAIDDFGVNLSADMVADSQTCDVPVYFKKRPFSPRPLGAHKSGATFVALTPPDYRHFRFGSAGFDSVEHN